MTLVDGFNEKIDYYYQQNQQLVHKDVIYFLAKTSVKKDGTMLSYEHNGFKWAEFSEAMDLLTFKKDRQSLAS